jgi:hypothetical protein
LLRRQEVAENLVQGERLYELSLHLGNYSKYVDYHLRMKKCVEVGCKQGAVNGGEAGKEDLCQKHGGGRRCSKKDCPKGAVSGGETCQKHGGGKEKPQCTWNDCSKKAAPGGVRGVELCIAHGGGKRCNFGSCKKGAQPGGVPGLCTAHGGGHRCSYKECEAGKQGPKFEGVYWCTRHLKEKKGEGQDGGASLGKGKGTKRKR